jgi:hypothetical protein
LEVDEKDGGSGLGLEAWRLRREADCSGNGMGIERGRRRVDREAESSGGWSCGGGEAAA